MGKLMRNNRKCQAAAVVEGCLGVRTRAKTRKPPVLMDFEGLRDKSGLDQEKETENSPTEMLLDEQEVQAEKEGGAQESVSEAEFSQVEAPIPGETQEFPEVSSENQVEEWDSKQNQDSQQNSQQETSSNMSTCVQEETEEEEIDHVSRARTIGSSLLRESHSDSCLDSRLGGTILWTAHSRSNSESFAHSEHEIEASYGDNVIVLSAMREKSQSSNVCHEGLSTSTTDQGGEGRAGSAAPTPGSTSRLPEHTRRPHLHRTDCRWRHTPTADEIEDFFSGVEDKDDRRRFIDKYNFDIINDVPLPGRFQWVQLQQ